MDKMVVAIIAIGVALVGAAIVSVLVSPNSQTATLFQTFGSSFSNAVGIGISPTTGQNYSLNLAYPNYGG